jgi:hypothetical protein
LRVKREKSIPRSDVIFHDQSRGRGVKNSRNVNVISLESDVGLVCREEEFIVIADPLERTMQDDLAKIPKLRIVANGEFAKAKQAHETSAEHTEEK